MANICDNRFYFQCEKNFDYYVEEFKKLIGLEPEQLEGDLLGEYYNNSDDDDPDGGWLEGWFNSKWSFPMHKFENMFSAEDGVYFRCLSEEYGCGYVAMNIFDDGVYFRCLSEEYGCGYVGMNIFDDGWRPEQTFDI